MALEWPSVPLSELVEPDRGITYGIVQPGIPVPDGVPIVRVTDIRNGRIDPGQPLRVSPDIARAYSRTRLRGGELLLTLVGTVGESAIVPPSLAGWNTARAVAVIPVRNEIGAYWVQTALRASSVQARIKSRLNTTVQATLNLRDVAQLPIACPPKGEREKITSVLGALDDKIELNRKMSATLEAMARAIFKSWFVDFDPVRAKAEGRRPEGMDEATAALFPDRFGEDGLPEGWDAKPIGELVSVYGGSTPSTKDEVYWSDGQFHWAAPRDLSGLSVPILLDTERKITSAGVAAISSGQLPIGTVLLSSRAPIGYLAIAEVPVSVNQGFIAMVCDRALPNLFVLLWARAKHGEILSRANGSTFLEISKGAFRPIPALRPPPKVLRSFMEICDPLYQRMRAATIETGTLSAIRDSLLPRLISGQLRVPDADSMTGAIG